MTIENCNITSKEFTSSLQNLPYSTPNTSKSLQSREPCVIEYNKYVFNYNLKIRKVAILRRFLLWAIHFRMFELVRQKRKLAGKCIYNLIYKFIIRKQWWKTIQAKILQNKHAFHLQYCLHKLMSIYYAKKKLKYLRKCTKNVICIQKNYRGHSCRKWHRRKFDRLYYFYSKIGWLAHKLLIIYKVRYVRQCILKVQSIIRMKLQLQQYKIFIKGIKIFQKYVKKYIFRIKIEQVYHSTIYYFFENIHNYMYKRLVAAFIISHNWKNITYNYKIRKFITKCSLQYDIAYIRNEIIAIHIQAISRGFLVRCRDFHRKQQIRLIQSSVLIIQRVWLIHTAYKQYAVKRDLFRSIKLRWSHLLRKRCRLILGVSVKCIQRKYRAILLQRLHFTSAITIQRFYRCYGAKAWSMIIDRAKRLNSIRIMGRFFLTITFRRRLLHWKYRKHMAIFKIQVRTYAVRLNRANQLYIFIIYYIYIYIYNIYVCMYV